MAKYPTELPSKVVKRNIAMIIRPSDVIEYSGANSVVPTALKLITVDNSVAGPSQDRSTIAATNGIAATKNQDASNNEQPSNNGHHTLFHLSQKDAPGY